MARSCLVENTLRPWDYDIRHDFFIDTDPDPSRNQGRGKESFSLSAQRVHKVNYHVSLPGVTPFSPPEEIYGPLRVSSGQRTSSNKRAFH
ncbi:hypothetical protein NPIL_510391 [Nephila pilipes]|uniref:Uncharacterized protein n=1 Tax=Nephila pilipes TaxID=299642 RepID=A0A8X6QGQ3_NEPPI|nr:hypothetical protein NPIL_510391 [Nephila pilipes]